MLLVACGTPSTSNSTLPVKSFPTQTSILITETPIPPTQTITPTFTQTAISTLSVDDAHKRLLDLLANNGNCQLPCLWGITPGKSTSQEAQITWSPLGSIQTIYDIKPRFGSDYGYISPAYVEDKLRLETNAEYISDNQIVNHIYFKAWEWKEFIASNGSQGLATIFDSLTFGQRTVYYSLAHVLSEQGLPTTVMIETSGPPPIYEGGGGFDIVLLYPNQGIWAHYTTQMYMVGSSVEGCPANAHIEMELYPPGNSDSFFTLLDKTDYWSARKNSYKPLEEATSMTLDEFYQTFRNPTNKCIQTSAKLWPTPENLGNN